MATTQKKMTIIREFFQICASRKNRNDRTRNADR
jgi:hypothetical protein